MYADDLLVMCKAGQREASTMSNCFNLYCQWLGQTANLEKTNIICSQNTYRRTKRKILDITWFKQMGQNAIYLGNSLVLGRNKSKEFGRLRECIQQRLEGWNKHLLLKAGKATLIKSVVQPIPTYTMSFFIIPEKVCKGIDALVTKFWWESKPRALGFLALKSWDNLCKPKNLRGFSFRKFKDMNMALLAKLSWKLASREKAIWIDLFHAKYLKG